MPADPSVQSGVPVRAARLPKLRTRRQSLEEITCPQLMNLSPPRLETVTAVTPVLVSRARSDSGRQWKKRNIINIGLFPVVIVFANRPPEDITAVKVNQDNYHYPLAACSIAVNDGTGGAVDGTIFDYDCWAVAIGGTSRVSVIEGEDPDIN